MNSAGYRFNFGDFDCAAVRSGEFKVEASSLFTNAPADSLTDTKAVC